MIENFKKFMKFASKTGLYLPAAYDARTNGPSISLLFAHIANALAIGGITALMFKDLKMGVYCSIGYSTLMLAFYLLRSLSKVKVDVDDGEIELDSGEPVAVAKEEKKDGQ